MHMLSYNNTYPSINFVLYNYYILIYEYIHVSSDIRLTNNEDKFFVNTIIFLSARLHYFNSSEQGVPEGSDIIHFNCPITFFLVYFCHYQGPEQSR